MIYALREGLRSTIDNFKQRLASRTAPPPKAERDKA